MVSGTRAKASAATSRPGELRILTQEEYDALTPAEKGSYTKALRKQGKENDALHNNKTGAKGARKRAPTTTALDDNAGKKKRPDAPFSSRGRHGGDAETFDTAPNNLPADGETNEYHRAAGEDAVHPDDEDSDDEGAERRAAVALGKRRQLPRQYSSEDEDDAQADAESGEDENEWAEAAPKVFTKSQKAKYQSSLPKWKASGVEEALNVRGAVPVVVDNFNSDNDDIEVVNNTRNRAREQAAQPAASGPGGAAITAIAPTAIDAAALIAIASVATPVASTSAAAAIARPPRARIIKPSGAHIASATMPLSVVAPTVPIVPIAAPAIVPVASAAVATSTAIVASTAIAASTVAAPVTSTAITAQASATLAPSIPLASTPVASAASSASAVAVPVTSTTVAANAGGAPAPIASTITAPVTGTTGTGTTIASTGTTIASTAGASASLAAPAGAGAGGGQVWPEDTDVVQPEGKQGHMAMKPQTKRVQAVLKQAMKIDLPFKLFFQNAYPQPLERAAYFRGVLTTAAEAVGDTDIASRLQHEKGYAAVLAKIPEARMSNLRGKLKDAADAVVPGAYKINEFPPDRHVRIVKWLLAEEDHLYIFPGDAKDSTYDDALPFCHPSIIAVIRMVFFGPKALAEFPTALFRGEDGVLRLPTAMVAASAAAVEAGLRGYMLGRDAAQVDFAGNQFFRSYMDHVATFQSLDLVTLNALLARLFAAASGVEAVDDAGTGAMAVGTSNRHVNAARVAQALAAA
ncbi:hypothetical protein FA95DRAFT_1613665 [Auriscalpium vulgare]|uniref:Uncharacterized protein n=1 Tax=Auriscalpium vulgare TaxID=40419 RepID=A0ACB8R238_9AGAM|nr:hypothetical protein FA95DRAFT_1613665 [Auriscalpium vulgare]